MKTVDSKYALFASKSGPISDSINEINTTPMVPYIGDFSLTIKSGRLIEEDKTITPEYSITVRGDTISWYATYERSIRRAEISTLEEKMAILFVLSFFLSYG